MTAISLAGVGKRYRIETGPPLLLDRLRPGRSRTTDLWALRDIDLEIGEGETVGVIGRNGSGKTTLLRLLSGVSGPTTGRLRVRGTVAPLIGVGVGFNPEMTGRENVFVNARLLGLSSTEVDAALDSIVDFSEIEQFLDSPVKYYSSGMFLRLAFAVAVHVRPQVLLVDEVLAVGDLAFQLKCMDRMRAIQAAGTTIVIVTHNLQLLDRMAPRGVLLAGGRVVFDGPVEGALSAYHAGLQGAVGAPRPDGNRLDGSEPVYGSARISAVSVNDSGEPTRHFAGGSPITLRVRGDFEDEVTNPVVGVMVAPLGLGAAYSMHTIPGSYVGAHGPDRPLELQVTLTNRLLDGSYSVTIGVHDAAGARSLGETTPLVFYVSSGEAGAYGYVDLAARITVAGQEITDPGRRRLDRTVSDQHRPS
ncbi:MAG: ABC transporter ATP-binding protein [Actinomycetota bacterium]|nr:ABC transporter ATP-binding protein [Actinomycetota bacterium]